MPLGGWAAEATMRRAAGNGLEIKVGARARKPIGTNLTYVNELVTVAGIFSSRVAHGGWAVAWVCLSNGRRWVVCEGSICSYDDLCTGPSERSNVAC